MNIVINPAKTVKILIEKLEIWALKRLCKKQGDQWEKHFYEYREVREQHKGYLALKQLELLDDLHEHTNKRFSQLD